jgi:hypothetical protein
MTRQTASRSPTRLRSILALFDVRKTSWGLVSAPLLHGVSGSSSFWDEVLTLGLIGGGLAVLAALALRGGRRRGKRRDE